MATTNSFLQSPFQSLINQQEQPFNQMPGSDAVKEVVVPELEAATVEPVKQAPAVTASPRKAAKPKSLVPPEELRPLFEVTAQEFGVPANVLMAIAQQESSYNNDATNSTTGAAGMAQYMDATAKSLKINPRDPNESIPATAMQLKERLDKGMSIDDAIREHFAGPNRKLWGSKTAAYGTEVLAKAEQIGNELYGEPAPVEQPKDQNNFAADRQGRADYEKNFRSLNPRADQAAVDMALGQYDEQNKARTKAKGSAVKDRFAALQSPEAMFNQRLDAKLQAGNKGVAQVAPGRMQPDDVNTLPTKERPGIVDQAVGDLGRGIENLRALGYGAGGLAADAAGDEEAATQLLDEYVNIQNDIAKNNPATIGTYKNVKSLGDAGRYAIEAVAENLPMLIPSLLSGGLGAQAAKKGAERLVGGMIEAQVAKGVAKEVAERQAAQFIAKRVMAGSIAGAVPASVAMEAGSIGGDIYKETGRVESGTALAYGVPAGLLDAVGPVMALRKIAGPIVDEVAGSVIRRLGAEAGKQFLAEAGTEGLQTIIEQAATAKEANRDLWTPELLDNVIDAALKGGIGGGVMGVASQGVAEARGAMAQPQAAAPQRVEPTMDPVPAQPGTEQQTVPAMPGTPAQVDDEGFTAQVMGDDGLMHTIDSRTGVTMAEAPAEPKGMLESALIDAAEQHANDPAPAPAMPEPEPAPPDYSTMPVDALRARLKEVAQLSQQDMAQRKQMAPERKAIERAINDRAKQAKADSKPAEEALSIGPFEDMKAANKMMSRYAEATGVPHEVVGSEGSFRVQRIKESDNGINSAGTEGGIDGRGRSSGTATPVGDGDGVRSEGAGDGTGLGSRGTAGERGDNPVPDRVPANGPADAQPALIEPARNPYQAYSASKPEAAASYMEKRGVDATKFEVKQTGPVRWQIVPRTQPVEAEVMPDVSERTQVPEEAPVEGGAQSAPQAEVKPKQGDPDSQGIGRSTITEPNAMQLTPKQYHEAKLKYMSDYNDVSLAEVREFYDNDASIKNHQQEWIDAIRLAAKEGQELTRATLDKLEDLRPRSVSAIQHDFPEAKIPVGYQTPQARKEEAEKISNRKADRAAVKAGAQQATGPINLVRMTNAADFDWSRIKPNGTYASIADDPASFVSPFSDDYKDGRRVDLQYTPKKPLVVGALKARHARFKSALNNEGETSAGVKALHAFMTPDQFTAAMQMSKAQVQDAIAKKFPKVDASKAFDAYEALEIWGAQEAKANGHDVIIARDEAMPEFSEAVLLEGAVPPKPVAKKPKRVEDEKSKALRIRNERQEAAVKRATEGEAKRKTAPNVAPKQVDSPAFKRWFGDSKVVNEAGAPLVVYHGTVNGDIRKFENGMASSTIANGQDFYFSDWAENASAYAKRGRVPKDGGRAVYPVYLALSDPLILNLGKTSSTWSQVDFNESNPMPQRLREAIGKAKYIPANLLERVDDYTFSIAQLANFAKNAGYDGLIAKDVSDGGSKKTMARQTTYVAFRPEQIKSSTGNSGAFDSSSPDIRFSVANELTDSPSASVTAAIQKLADDGKIVLHAEAKDLPFDGKMPAGVQAMTAKDGTIHVVAGSDMAVVLHEAFHSGAQKLIGTAKWNSLMTRLDALYRQSEKSSGKAREFFDAARGRVATAKAKGAVANGMAVEEFGAYAIEEYESAPMTVRKWTEDIIGTVKAWALRRFGVQLGQVSPAQLSALAKSALADVRTSRDEAAFSSSPDKTIEVDGKSRSIVNSRGQLIAPDLSKQRAFHRWFGDSKVVDDQQRPVMLYHGTASDFNEFDAAKLGNNTREESGELGFFFTSKGFLSDNYAEIASKGGWANKTEKGNQVVYPVYLSIENPKIYTTASAFYRDADEYKGRLNEWRKELESEGFDGVVVRKDFEEVIVFSPTQIKSATGNVGTFDKANVDIRFSVAGSPQPRSLTPDEQGMLRRVQAQIQDANNRVKQVQDRIKEVTGVDDLGNADYYRAETNRPGRIAARKEDARDKMFGPLMANLAKAGYKPAQLEEILHAQHAKERNANIAAINPEHDPASPEYSGTQGSGMNDDKADEILKKYANDPELKRFADQARNIAKETLELKLQYGLITPADHESLVKSYENYVPLKGDGEYGPKVKRAMGHGARNENIMENIARDYEQAVVVGEKNLARQSLLQMVLQFPDDGLWTARVPPKGRMIAGKVYNIVDVGPTAPANGETVASFTSRSQVDAFLEGLGANRVNHKVLDSNGEQVAEFTKPLQDNEVMVYLKGDPVRLQIFDESLAGQLRPLHGEQMNVVLDLMRRHNRYLSMIFTGYNPDFIIKNATRDAITGTINMTGNHGAVTSAKAWAKYPAAWSTLLQWAATKKTPNTEMGRMLDEYRAQGGKTGASYMSDLEEQGKDLARMFDDAKGAFSYAKDGQVGKAAWIAARKAIGGLAHAVELLNQAFENALRLALFAQLRAEGKKPGVAAAAAKSVTVNFDRKGVMTPELGAFFLFINPAIQGTANMARTMTQGEHKYQAWALTGMMAAAGFAAAVHGMDDDKDRWLGESWATRTKALRMRVGETTINIPMSYEFAPFYAIGVAMGEVSRGESSMRAAIRTMSSFLDAYYPMQGAVQPGSDNSGMDLMLAHLPTVARVPGQVWLNRNSFGSQVVPETNTTKNRPDNLKMNRGTKNSVYDKTAQAIADAGELVGADKYSNDLTKVSPETLKLIYSTYTGGLGRFIADSAGFAGLSADSEIALELADVPIIKSFARGDNMKPIRTRYFDLSDEARKSIDEFAQAKKMGDRDEMRRIVKDPERRMHLALTKMVKSVNEVQGIFSDQAVLINADKDLTPAEKRAKLKEIEDEQEAIYRKSIKAFQPQ